MVERQRVLVLGASGLIGSAVARALSKDNEVTGLARFRDEDAAGDLESDGVKVVRRDVSQGDLGDLEGEFDYVFNEVLLPPALCKESPELAFRTHAFAVAGLCQRFRRCKGLILGSTGSVYKPCAEPINEDAALGGNGDPRVTDYALSKICGDAFATYFSETLGVPVAILRYYQPYDVWPIRCTSWLRRMADSIRRGDRVYDSPVLVNPIFVADVAAMTVRAAAVCSSPPTVINVGGKEIVSMKELAIMIGEASGRPPRFAPCSDSIAESQVCDSRKRVELLGEQEIQLREGIGRVMMSFPKESAE